MKHFKAHLKGLERINSFRLIDDDFMVVCFDENIECTELMLRIILDIPDLEVKSVKTQKIMKNLLGRDIWLDIHARDGTGREFNVEIQRSDKGADRKRARYHSSILDSHLLKPGDDFGSLPETYVIFITENDVIGENKPIYFIDRQITNIGKPFNDGEHIIYVNGADRNSTTSLGKLMHDFFCTNADDMNYKELADTVRYYKEDEKGVATMSRVMDELRKEAADRKSVEIALNLFRMGKLTLEEISEVAGLSLDRVKEITSKKVAR